MERPMAGSVLGYPGLLPAIGVSRVLIIQGDRSTTGGKTLE